MYATHPGLVMTVPHEPARTTAVVLVCACWMAPVSAPLVMRMAMVAMKVVTVKLPSVPMGVVPIVVMVSV